MLLFDKYDAQLFTDALGVELKTETDIQAAAEKVMKNLDEDMNYYNCPRRQYEMMGVTSDGKIALRKGKKAMVGEVRTYNGIKKKKVAEGKWVPVSEGKSGEQQPDEKDKKDKKKKPLDEEQEKEQKEQRKMFIKTVAKKVISALGEVLSGKGGANTAAQTVEETGEGVESKGYDIKEANKRKEIEKKNRQKRQLEAKKEAESQKKKKVKDDGR